MRDNPFFFGSSENAIDQSDASVSSFKFPSHPGTLVCSSLNVGLKCGSQPHDHWPSRDGRNYGEGAKNSDRAAARFGLNRPIKSRQSHCRRESSEDRLLFFTRRTRLPGRSAVRPSQRGYSDSRARFGPVDHLGPKNWSHNQKSHSVLSWLLRTRRRPTAVPATSRGDWNVSGKRTKAGHAPQWPS